LPSYDKFTAPAIPALILAWPDDKTHPMETAKELNALLPKSELVIANSINDVAKWPQIIYKFIEEISSKR
jgi:pimeloyl-ACP methyl ester carboxylesterase